MDDSENTTSIDDRSEAYSEASARDCLAEGIIGLLLPTVEQIDERVRSTRISQLELRQHIDALAEDLRALSENQQIPYDLDSYVKKLVNAKRRVVLVNSILQNTQEITRSTTQLSVSWARRTRNCHDIDGSLVLRCAGTSEQNQPEHHP
ncbi:SNARE-associated protein Snapin isoform X2 [Dermacentor andersoni]|uniref:SNARE-associated protein Snapin isoform X2 n=1 Tax=Dermacentor andersoni TaxID=34620 RepID=UPI002417F122|nr:SNARE-associated protein Snapin-like isoform X2 [Dermacentor andersoni]